MTLLKNDASPFLAIPLEPLSTTPGAGRRSLAYTLVLAAASVVILFTNLGGPRLEGDEAHYALCVDGMRRTGDWLTLSPIPPSPYFNKPPLSMWLTAAVYDHLPAGVSLESRYRFWSALSGVGCVTLTCLLGAWVLAPEIGALGAGLLLTNHAFLLEHGARQGDMDSLLTLTMLGAMSCYWLMLTARSRNGHRVGCLGLGIAVGLACMLKPMAGVPMLALLAAHAALFGRLANSAEKSAVVPRWHALRWTFLAAAPALLVAAPWYLYETRKFGSLFVRITFGGNIIRNVTVGLDPRHAEGPLYYLRSISSSSPPFLLFMPALLLIGLMAVPKRNRRSGGAEVDREVRFGLLAVVSLGWLLLFSLSPSKFLHYAYPVFPAICLSMATLFAWIARSVERLFKVGRCVWFTAAGGLLVQCTRLAFVVMPEQQVKYVPWQMYSEFRPAIDSGNMRMVFCGIPGSPAQFMERPELFSSDLFYFSHMRGIVSASPEQMGALMKEPFPTLLMLGKAQDVQPLYERLHLAGRFDPRFVFEDRAYTAAAVDTQPLLHFGWTPTASSPNVTLLTHGDEGPVQGATLSGGVPVDGTFTMRVKLPLPEDTRLTVVLRPASSSKMKAVRCIISGTDDPLPAPLAVPFVNDQRFTVVLRRDWRSPRPNLSFNVKFTLRSAVAAPGSTAKDTLVPARLMEADMEVRPRQPQEWPLHDWR